MHITQGMGSMAYRDGCVMQQVIWDFTNGQCSLDRHPCFNAPITGIAQSINDGLDDDEREELVDFIPRLERCRTAADPEIEACVNHDMALWLLERVYGVTETDLLGTSTVNAVLLSLRAIFRKGNYGVATGLLAGYLNPSLENLDEAIETWEKSAADHGALGNPKELT